MRFLRCAFFAPHLRCVFFFVCASQARSNGNAPVRMLQKHMATFFDDAWGGLLALRAPPALGGGPAPDSTHAYGSTDAVRKAQLRWAAVVGSRATTAAAAGAT